MSIITVLHPKGYASVIPVIDNEKQLMIATTYEGEDVEATDSYHTMSELYDMRLALCVALFKTYDTYITPLATPIKCWKSKLHPDGTMFDGYFIVGMTIPQLEGPDKQISFHYKLEHWNKFHCITLIQAPCYDHHTSKDVIERLMRL